MHRSYFHNVYLDSLSLTSKCCSICPLTCMLLTTERTSSGESVFTPILPCVTVVICPHITRYVVQHSQSDILNQSRHLVPNYSPRHYQSYQDLMPSRRIEPRGPSRPDLTYEILNLLGFVVDSWIRRGFWQIPNNIHATCKKSKIHRIINIFYVDSWILIRNPDWIPTCSASRDGPFE